MGTTFHFTPNLYSRVCTPANVLSIWLLRLTHELPCETKETVLLCRFDMQEVVWLVIPQEFIAAKNEFLHVWCALTPSRWQQTIESHLSSYFQGARWYCSIFRKNLVKIWVANTSYSDLSLYLNLQVDIIVLLKLTGKSHCFIRLAGRYHCFIKLTGRSHCFIILESLCSIVLFVSLFLIITTPMIQFPLLTLRLWN